MRRSLVVLASLFLLAACDTGESLDALQTATPASDPYQAALAQGYKDFAQAEYNEADWLTSDYLASKGLAAAEGKAVNPEQPIVWGISSTAQPEYIESRRVLIKAVDANKSTQPTLTANAVLAYDHWVVTTHNQTDAGRTEERHQAFVAALANLQSVHAVEPGIAAPSSEPVAPAAAATSHAPAILYFPFDSDTLGSSANSAIAKLAGDIQAAPKANVSINGHTDRAGTEQYNLALSERRAKFVLHALEAAGVPDKRMHYFAFGESDPAVPTADGVREPRNRRVEVILDQ